ncbi:MAG TPA: SCP2 sterol-binding domain-containing protein [Acidobacteriota bacterium]|nr:SCP2 sterol-binding domain-containing protein [Acidobacteriota bacterium]HNG91270.1 SCP2 sterol-binding domain-containing protein [Acidobacteriota bacterium]HNH84187.1 SCP2 sterol-binding domain-containing protein [Acidobacteriota bacterium]HNJ40161.1 SCP2 sterol-binding domain-containing protein [Acidobacteriota bacterium]
MAQTVGEIFKGMKSAYKKGAFKEEKSFYFSLGDDKWTVIVGPKKCVVEAGKTIEQADCVLKTSPELFVKMWNREHTPGMGDFMSGRVKSNDPSALKTFLDAFD